MRLPQAAPGEGGKRSNSEHWSYWEIGGGEKHSAYVAGPTQWFVCHPSSRTKPCVHWMTQGAVTCLRCAQQKDTDTCGYVPLWRGVDWRPLFVVVYETEREWLDQYQLHQRVLVGREKGLGARVWVRDAGIQEPKFSTTVARRREPQDITAALLTIWGIPELRAWCGMQPGASDNALSLDLDAKKAAPEKERAEEKKPPVKLYTAEDRMRVGDVVDDEVKRLLRHARESERAPSRNGKRKEEGGGE